MTKPAPLQSHTVELNSGRVQILTPESALPIDPLKVQTGMNGEKVCVIDELDEEEVRIKLQSVLNYGISSLAVSLHHSYSFPHHELQVGKIAKELGFKQISLSHTLSPSNRLLPRLFVAACDAYLSPVVNLYCSSFISKFSTPPNVSFMKSDGGLSPIGSFSGARAVLSGPAGGVTGLATRVHRLALNRSAPVIGFDMGGTSTDVSIFDGKYEVTYEAHAAGVPIHCPQIDIATVAAGGGSVLHLLAGGLLACGPLSAGANPGPTCYRLGGPLTVTDAQAVLGRLPPAHFPKIFGKNRDEELDIAAAHAKFEILLAKLHEGYDDVSALPQSVEALALGFIKVANATMARPISDMTRGRGRDPTHHVLGCFGGAGGNHAIAMAKSLGMSKVIIPKFAGILSAYGIATADTTREVFESISFSLNDDDSDSEANSQVMRAMHEKFEILKTEVANLLVNCDNISIDHVDVTNCVASMRYLGTETRLHVAVPKLFGESLTSNLLTSFKERYEREFGFIPKNSLVLIEELRVTGIGRSSAADMLKMEEECEQRFQEQYEESQINNPRPAFRCEPIDYTPIWFAGDDFSSPVPVCIERTPIFDSSSFRLGMSSIEGPALVVDRTTTVLIEPNCTLSIARGTALVIHIHPKTIAATAVSQPTPANSTLSDPIVLSVFSHRIMSIAETMGRTLQRVARSVNIKDRLDFSCAVFSPDGSLVANAPHLPVHLGSMQNAVSAQISLLGENWKEGQVILANHPAMGGSHLPDLTVISPVWAGEGTERKPAFYVASRGHHADIGGITPGSMPPFSTSLTEEGAAIKSLKIVENGEFLEEKVRDAFGHGDGKLLEEMNALPFVPSRAIDDNICDLKAQVAANARGVSLLAGLIQEESLEKVQLLMKQLQDASCSAVEDLLVRVAHDLNKAANKPANSIVQFSSEDGLDDGSRIKLKVTIDPIIRRACFDFHGTTAQSFNNLNCPRPVVCSAVIYSLRAMVDDDVPLNSGCLVPVEVLLPPKGRSLLSPTDDAAIVAGNVLTSQRVTDVIFHSFGACANAYGCMNNFTFGGINNANNGNAFSFYETIGGGMGAGPSWDGASAVQAHMTNTHITDCETVERRFPILLRSFSIRKETGGDGKYRGGDGICRAVQFLSNASVSLLTERRVLSPKGLRDGEDGKRGVNLLLKCQSKKYQYLDFHNIENYQDNTTADEYNNVRIVQLPPKCTFDVNNFDIVCILTPGGAGYGLSANKCTQINNDDTLKEFVARGGSYDFNQRQLTA